MSKFSVNTKQFAGELAYVCNISESANNTNPHFQNVIIQVEGETLKLSKANNDAWGTSFITLPKPAPEPVSIALRAEKLLSVAKLLQVENVNFSVSDSKVTVTAGKGRYAFTNSPETVNHLKTTFSMLQAPQGEKFQVNTEKLARLITLGSTYVADKEDTKVSLTGISLKLTPEKMVVTAMDGRRVVDIFVEDKVDGRDGVLFLERNTIKLLQNMVNVERAEIVKADGMLHVTAGNRMVAVRRTASDNKMEVGAFIDKNLADPEVSVLIDAVSLERSVKVLQTAIDGPLRKMVFTVTPEGLNLKTSNIMSGCQEFEEDLVAVTKGETTVLLNAPFVLDFLKSVKGMVKIVINPSRQNHAALFTNETNDIRCMISYIK